jgi:transcriptional regulator with XRE-family HTH domain
LLVIDVVARAVHAHRTALGLSLDQLAARAGLAKGSVVAIENSASNPNLATLVRLADALAVPVSALLDDTDQNTVRVIDTTALAPLWMGPKGGRAWLALSTPGVAPVELWHWVLPAGERYDSHPHPHGVTETITVTSGRAILTVAGAEHDLSAGTTASFAADAEHSYEGARPDGAQLIMTVHLPPAAKRGQP